jgi:hypothetical protein
VRPGKVARWPSGDQPAHLEAGPPVSGIVAARRTAASVASPGVATGRDVLLGPGEGDIAGCTVGAACPAQATAASRRAMAQGADPVKVAASLSLLRDHIIPCL